MSDEHTPLPPRTDGIPRSATHDRCRARIAELDKEIDALERDIRVYDHALEMAVPDDETRRALLIKARDEEVDS